MQLCRDAALGADRHLDITFGLQVVETLSLFLNFLEKHRVTAVEFFFIPSIDRVSGSEAQEKNYIFYISL